MKPLDEVPHLLTAYRQLGDDGRLRLVRRIFVIAVEKAGLAGKADLDRLVPECLEVERSGITPVARAGAGLALLCVRWLEAPEASADLFLLIALQYVRTDAQVNMRTGRPKSALGAKGKYLRLLRLGHRTASANDLYDIALSEADTSDSPFGKEDGELYDKEREQMLPREKFAKKLPAKNPRKR